MAMFVVHEHHARHHHFDLRLEMQGVLKSWAVPKGPSMDPAQKRLAIQVDDHGLEYGSFEGEIAEGEYGAGKVRIWDSGEFLPLGGGLQEGKLEFELRGMKLKGAFALVRLRGKPGSHSKDEWLLIKKKEARAARTSSRKAGRKAGLYMQSGIN